MGQAPILADTDGDSYSDKVEILNSSNPTDANDYPFFIDEGLVLHLPLDGKPNDYSKFKRKSSVKYAKATEGPSGASKKAFSFDGEKSYIEVSYSGVVENAARSVSGWILPAPSNNGTIISWGKTGNIFSIGVESGTIHLASRRRNAVWHYGPIGWRMAPIPDNATSGWQS